MHSQGNGSGAVDGIVNFGPSFAYASQNKSVDWFGTVRGRIGVTFPSLPNLLLYATGGLAYGGVVHSANVSDFYPSLGVIIAGRRHELRSNENRLDGRRRRRMVPGSRSPAVGRVFRQARISLHRPWGDDAQWHVDFHRPGRGTEFLLFPDVPDSLAHDPRRRELALQSFRAWSGAREILIEGGDASPSIISTDVFSSAAAGSYSATGAGVPGVAALLPRTAAKEFHRGHREDRSQNPGADFGRRRSASCRLLPDCRCERASTRQRACSGDDADSDHMSHGDRAPRVGGCSVSRGDVLIWSHFW